MHWLRKQIGFRAEGELTPRPPPAALPCDTGGGLGGDCNTGEGEVNPAVQALHTGGGLCGAPDIGGGLCGACDTGGGLSGGSDTGGGLSGACSTGGAEDLSGDAAAFPPPKRRATTTEVIPVGDKKPAVAIRVGVNGAAEVIPMGGKGPAVAIPVGVNGVAVGSIPVGGKEPTMVIPVGVADLPAGATSSHRERRSRARHARPCSYLSARNQTPATDTTAPPLVLAMDITAPPPVLATDTTAPPPVLSSSGLTRPRASPAFPDPQSVHRRFISKGGTSTHAQGTDLFKGDTSTHAQRSVHTAARGSVNSSPAPELEGGSSPFACSPSSSTTSHAGFGVPPSFPPSGFAPISRQTGSG